MQRNVFLAIVATVLTLIGVAVFAQSNTPDTANLHSSMHATTADQPDTSWQDMMQMQQAMQKRMTTMDARLEGLVTEMNKAKGQAKVDRMAAVINELVSQRVELRNQIMTMQPMMNGWMMNHMNGMNGMMGNGMHHGMVDHDHDADDGHGMHHSGMMGGMHGPGVMGQVSPQSGGNR